MDAYVIPNITVLNLSYSIKYKIQTFNKTAFVQNTTGWGGI
jgi:hypothetical protein